MIKITKLDDFQNIWMVDGFEKEYQRMFGKSNRQYHRCLETLYRNLALLDAGDITDRYQFEKIEDNLYSIRSKSVMNPRVLYTYRNERGQYILLLPFLEKSKSDYEEGKRRARQQIKNLGGILYE